MSQQTSPLTYEGVLDLFRKSDRRFDRRMKKSDEKFDRRIEEFDKRMEILQKQMGDHGLRIGDLVEHMIGGKNVLEQFQDLGYNVTDHYRNRTFGIRNTGSSGQIDMILEDGDVAILIEVKTKLKNDDVLDHIERLKKYRRWMDGKGLSKMRYIGALACAVVEDNVVQFAQRKGMYVIRQLGNAVEIVDLPEGFKAKEW